MIDLADGSVRPANVLETPLAMYVVDLSGKVIRWSRALGDLLRISACQAMDRVLWELRPCMTRNGSVAKIEDAFRGIPSRSMHFSCIPEQNRYFKIHITRRPFYHHDKVAGAVGVVDWLKPVAPFTYGDEDASIPGKVIAAALAFVATAIANLPWTPSNIVDAYTLGELMLESLI